MNTIEAGVQTNISEERPEDLVQHFSTFHTRQDVLKIRKKLESIVQPEYFQVLTRFIHGLCSKTSFDSAMQHYLQTNEAKNLHNQFLRTIIFNAHFASSAPPNVTVHPPKKIHIKEISPTFINDENKKKVLTMGFKTYTAADMGHLPSIEQIIKRTEMILKSKKYQININDEAAKAVVLGLRIYLTKILIQCLKLCQPRIDLTKRTKITIEPLLYLIRKNDNITSGVISPSLIAKYDPSNYNPKFTPFLRHYQI